MSGATTSIKIQTFKMDVVHDHNYIENIKKQLANKSENELTPEEKWRLEHIKIHEQHKGHESMHAEMVIILLVTLVMAQILLVQWKQWHYRSYQMVTLIGMWLVPIVICIRNQSWRFIFIWLLFSCITGLIFRKSLEKPIDGTTPRLVYKWFYFLYKLSYGLGIAGYVILMATFLGVNLLFGAKPHAWMDCGVLLLFYGLYYGVLGRDIAEICADKMASHIGFIYFWLTSLNCTCALVSQPLLVVWTVLPPYLVIACPMWQCLKVPGLFCSIFLKDLDLLGKALSDYLLFEHYYNAKGMPTRSLDQNVCAVCGNKLLTPVNEDGVLESTYKLSCDHVFHEFCIRGWCIVGKKQTCPYCKEKVDLKKMFCNPWERPHVLYGQLLDWIRWLVAWQPCIFFLVQGINWVLGLE